MAEGNGRGKLFNSQQLGSREQRKCTRKEGTRNQICVVPKIIPHDPLINTPEVCSTNVLGILQANQVWQSILTVTHETGMMAHAYNPSSLGG